MYKIRFFLNVCDKVTVLDKLVSSSPFVFGTEITVAFFHTGKSVEIKIYLSLTLLFQDQPDIFGHQQSIFQANVLDSRLLWYVNNRGSLLVCKDGKN